MIQEITPVEARVLIDAGEAVLIDVRDPEEFSEEHIASAVSMPLGGLQGSFPQYAVPAGKKIIFQCLMGGRSMRACQMAVSAFGCENEVFNLVGGIQQWKEDGLETVAQKEAIMPLFRQVQLAFALVMLFCVALSLAGLPVFAYIAAALALVAAADAVIGRCWLAMIVGMAPWNK